MPLIVPNASELTMLTAILEAYEGSDLKLKLYKNDYTPTASSTVANFTEATFGGYSEVTLTYSDWTIATVSNNAKAVWGEEPIVWTVTADAHTVYGYYVVDNAETTLVWAEKYTVAKSLTISDTPQFQPTFSLRTDE